MRCGRAGKWRQSALVAQDDSLLQGTLAENISGFDDKIDMHPARALYRRPRILILDEGTSHLDVETEKAVNAALSNLAITRLVVAHRPETLRAAGRVVSLEGGVAREASAVLDHQQERSHENVDT